MYYTVKIKFPKIIILISEILSPAKLDDQKRITMNINSLLQTNDIKQIWHIINNIMNSKVENIVKKIIQDDVFREDSDYTANMFNDLFIPFFPYPEWPRWQCVSLAYP